MANIFELNTLDVLGSGFRNYLSEIRALSLTNPKSYFLLRKEISTKIVDIPVALIYKTIFCALTKGQEINGDALASTPAYGAGTDCYVPQYPSQKANIIAMRLAEILEQEMEQILQTLLPLSFDNVASTSLSFQTRNTMTNGVSTSGGSGSSSASST